jgi:hypothetical protein
MNITKVIGAFLEYVNAPRKWREEQYSISGVAMYVYYKTFSAKVDTAIPI